MNLTPLEIEVLGRVARGEDPWRGATSNTRKVSQALQRLKRKGAVAVSFSPGHCYVATEEGAAYLAGKVSPPPA